MITKVGVFGERPAPPLSLGGFMPSDDPVIIRDIDGLGPNKADVNTIPLAGQRGEKFQDTSNGKRNIVLTLGLNPNWTNQTISSLRQQLYAYFMTEQWCKLRFFSDEIPVTDIEGHVESFDPNIFSQDPEVQISVVCENPDFIEIDASILKGVVDDGTNEHVVDYLGTVSSGLELRVDRSVDVPAYSGPVSITVKNYKGVYTITVDPVTIDTTKSYKMSSIQGQKRIQNESIIGDGVITNLMKVKEGDWPKLWPGENLISVAADTPGQNWTLAYFNRFGGL